jgi:hypothetical protein
MWHAACLGNCEPAHVSRTNQTFRDNRHTDMLEHVGKPLSARGLIPRGAHLGEHLSGRRMSFRTRSHNRSGLRGEVRKEKSPAGERGSVGG